MNLKPTTVYVPVKVDKKIAFLGDTPLINYLQSNCHTDTNNGITVFMPANTFLIEGGYPIVHQNLELRHEYLLTEEQLLELKKGWMRDAWEAGSRSMGANKKLVSNGGKNGIHVNSAAIIEDKQSFLNSIKL
jgi:hypothetical protein